ncbi:beta-lactamase/transpeptidase-like protein [Ramaria rubella]|nr:beta-lactamase/transpeptidase-like protein [Ramaria rubella]
MDMITSLLERWRRPYQQVSSTDPDDPQSTATTNEPVSKKNNAYQRGLLSFLVCSLALNGVVTYKYSTVPKIPPRRVPPQCPAPLPRLLATAPPSASDPRLINASDTFKTALQAYFDESRENLDSVAVALITSNDTVLELFHGPLRANETSGDNGLQVDRHSIYRIASISKLFTAFETFILRERGAVNLDDPVAKYVSQVDAASERDPLDPITLRQLMSHMSGLGRDWPPETALGWPHSLNSTDSPLPNRARFLEALNSNNPIADSYTYPIYSNTGYNLLGYANVRANEKYEKETGGKDIPTTHAQLMERDVIRPLGLNGSSFLITNENARHAAVSSAAPFETDMDFNATNPAGGQVASLSDLVKLSQSLLNPSAKEALLPPKVLREWLRAIHAYWDGHTAMGMLWEIYKVQDSFKQNVDVFQKMGDLQTHHTAFSLIPARSFGVVVLTTGAFSHAYDLTNIAIDHFLPAFDEILAEKTLDEIGGHWVGTLDSAKLDLQFEIINGSLYATRYDYTVDETDTVDVLHTLQGVSVPRIAVWDTGNNEYRYVSAWRLQETSQYNFFSFRSFAPSRGLGNYGCFSQWVNLDGFAYGNNASVNLLRLIKEGPATSNILHIPSMQVNLTRH